MRRFDAWKEAREPARMAALPDEEGWIPGGR